MGITIWDWRYTFRVAHQGRTTRKKGVEEVNVEETPQQVPPRKSGSLLWMYSVVLVLALVVLGGGIYQVASGRGGYTIMAAGLVSVIAVLLVWFFSINMRAERQEATRVWEEHIAPVNERLQYI